MKLSNKAYDTLKAIFEILVLLATFWVDIASAWNLPYVEPIQKTLMAASAVILGILKISTAKYNKDLYADSKEERDDELNPDIVSHEDKDGVG